MLSAQPDQHADRHRGPSLLAVGIVHVALFLASLVFSTVMARGEHFPSPFQPEALSHAWFVANRDAVRVGAFFAFGASVPLGIFTATAASRLRFLGVNVAGESIALFGGLSASLWLALSGLVEWALAWPGVQEASTIRALHLVVFAAGGIGFMVAFGLLLAGVSLSAGLARLLPRWLMWFGLVLAALAELSALTLLFPVMAWLLPAVRFPGLVWLICVGALLPGRRGQHYGTGARLPAVARPAPTPV
jgi:hypothetical protein